MSAFDLIWNLVMMLIDRIEDSKNEKETKRIAISNDNVLGYKYIEENEKIENK